MEKEKQKSILKMIICFAGFVVAFFIVLLFVQNIKFQSLKSDLQKTQGGNESLINQSKTMDDEISYRETTEYEEDLLRQERGYGENEDILIR